jgi:hypothetical protein
VLNTVCGKKNKKKFPLFIWLRVGSSLVTVLMPEGGLAAGEEREEEKEEPDAVEDTEFVLIIEGDSTVNYAIFVQYNTNLGRCSRADRWI